MVHIKVVKGLDIPIKGKPIGDIQALTGSGEASPQETPPQLALNLQNFDLRFHLLAKEGTHVKLGEPIAEDKACPGRFFVSPAAGTISEVRRGLKRLVSSLVIDVDKEEEYFKFPTLDPEKASREEIVEHLKRGGAFSKIRMRPLDRLADPTKTPKRIFVKAIESAPFMPKPEWQVQGHETAFQSGLTALKKLTDGEVHLIYSLTSRFEAFQHAKNVVLHTVEGPHPAGNASIHIESIAPISSLEDEVWTLNAHDVTCIGQLLLQGRVRHDRVISIAGPGILPGRSRYFRIRDGFPIARLISGRTEKGPMRLISGDPLLGHQVAPGDFLGFSDFAFCVIPENIERQFLHFFRFGVDKYSFSRAYLSGHLDNRDREYLFTTSLHGEHRAFLDSSLYDRVQPLHIPTMLLVKAIMAEDFELAEQLGLLEVAPEDFALPTFVCPSKMEMVEIVKKGLKRYAEDMLSDSTR